MTKYLITHEDLKENIGKKIVFNYDDMYTIEGILEYNDSNQFKCNGFYITDTCGKRISVVKNIELIEENYLCEINKNLINLVDNNVNHPNHYQGKIECIDYLKDKLTIDEFKGFLKGNILKYMSRAGKKDNELQDIKKAKWYLDYLINFIEEK